MKYWNDDWYCTPKQKDNRLDTCIYTGIHAYTGMHTAHIYTHSHALTHVCAHTCTHLHVNACIHMKRHVYLYTERTKRDEKRKWFSPLKTKPVLKVPAHLSTSQGSLCHPSELSHWRITATLYWSSNLDLVIISLQCQRIALSDRFRGITSNAKS